jgi:hypothetical protein
MAEQINLAELTASADGLFKKLATMFKLNDQEVVPLPDLLEQFMAYYIPH